MFDKPLANLGEDEQGQLFPLLDALCEEVVAAQEGLRLAEARHCYALSRHERVFAAASRIPRHIKSSLIRELEYVGMITGQDAKRLSGMRDKEVVAEMRARVKRYNELAARYNQHTELIASHPIVAVVTKEKCRIDSDTILVFQDLIDEHLHGMNIHGFGSATKPTWQECYDWIVQKKDSNGRPRYCRSVGSPTWTSAGLKRYFQSWCRHFGFSPKDITSECRPDIKAVLLMRGLPPNLTPSDWNVSI